jgi:hypothetical protein
VVYFSHENADLTYKKETEKKKGMEKYFNLLILRKHQKKILEKIFHIIG